MRRALVPALVLGLAALNSRLGPWTPDPSVESRALWLQICWGVCAAIFLLAWRFRRGRFAAAALLLAAVAAVAAWDEGRGADVVLAVHLLLPIHLALLGLLREWPVASAAGGWRFGVLAAEGLGLGLLHRSGTRFEELEAKLADLPAWTDRLGLPHWPALAFAAAAAVLAVVAWRRRGPLELGLLGALGASFLACRDGAPAAYWLTAAALVLGLALLENAFTLAFEDGLTGLPARRALEEDLRHLGRAYAVAMVDLDHFKRFNDRHGHEVGDQVLKMVAARLARVGGGGRAFRYGGEEFSLLFPDRSAAEAELYAEEVRRAVAAAPFKVRSPGRPKKTRDGKPARGRASGRGSGEKRLKVTVSVGVAERDARNRTPEEVLKAADKALYRAKKAGRNRVAIGR